MTDFTALIARIEKGSIPEPNTERDATMTPLTTRIVEILEAQQVEEVRLGDPDFPRDQVIDHRILGIATTATKIVEAAAELGAAPGWNEAIEAAAKLFEPGCSCPEPCEDYLIWPSPCATKAAERIRSLRRPDAPAKSNAPLSEALTEIRAGLAGIPFDSDAQISDAAPAIEPSAPFLWCCHIRGPDDVLACETYAAALKMADALNDVSSRINAQFPPGERVRYSAVPAPWPWSDDAHAGDLKRQREGK